MNSAIIADDEPHLAEFLGARLASLWPELEIAGYAASGNEALQLIERLEPDVAFLDIRMPGLSGLEVAAGLGERACRIVFVTAFDEFAIEAFEHHAIDYLLKPVTDERLSRTVEHLKAALRERRGPPALDALLAQLQQSLGTRTAGAGHMRWVRVAVGEEVRQIPVEDVLCFRAADKYTIVEVVNEQHAGELLIRTGLSELLDQLDPELFWQVHRSIVVNASHVLSARRDVMGKTMISLRGRGAQLPVSRQYAHRFRHM